MEIYHIKTYQIHNVTWRAKFSRDFLLKYNSQTSIKDYWDDNTERLIENKAWRKTRFRDKNRVKHVDKSNENLKIN